MLFRAFTALAMALCTVPAAAAGGSAGASAGVSTGAQVPEGSQLTLFALGILGVIVGRHLSRTRQRKRD